MNCRHCHKPLHHVFLDLKDAPPSNSYLTKEQLGQPEARYPLRLFVCDQCWLVQTEDFARAEDLFAMDYAYFSSTSTSWLDHAEQYCAMIIRRLDLNRDSFVIEVASNDGYLLRNFIRDGIPCLGIEPTDSTADAAVTIGIPVLREFFGVEAATALAEQGKRADLIAGNNVYAHVPDINDFTRGLQIALKPGGTITLEFPHLLQLIDNNQFDTVYHEHFSYLSLGTVQSIFAAARLRIIDVEELSTHGGSLRVYGCHTDDVRPFSPSVGTLLEKERAYGMRALALYRAFQAKADRVRDDFKAFLEARKSEGKSIAAYGAAAKGNTLINYAGIGNELIEFVCDAAKSKQGKFLPGSHIPILAPSALAERKPDWVVILPWNISGEVMRQQPIGQWGGRFVVAVPKLTELN